MLKSNPAGKAWCSLKEQQLFHSCLKERRGGQYADAVLRIMDDMDRQPANTVLNVSLEDMVSGLAGC